MEVGLEDVSDSKPEGFGRSDIDLYITPGIHDGATGFPTNEVRYVSQALRKKTSDMH
jgi:hypothetical protein